MNEVEDSLRFWAMLLAPAVITVVAVVWLRGIPLAVALLFAVLIGWYLLALDMIAGLKAYAASAPEGSFICGTAAIGAIAAKLGGWLPSGIYVATWFGIASIGKLIAQRVKSVRAKQDESAALRH